MSFAIHSYLAIQAAAQQGNWESVVRHQAAVSAVFASMQDDPGKFADLQRAKVIMGLGQPITRDVSEEQIERVFAALEQLPAGEARVTLLRSFDLLSDGPNHDRLQSLSGG